MPIKESLGLAEEIHLCESICFDYANQCKDDEDQSEYRKYTSLGNTLSRLRLAHISGKSITEILMTIHHAS